MSPRFPLLTLVLVFATAAPLPSAETPITKWPAYYECLDGRDYYLVILREDQTADFLISHHKEKGKPWFFHDHAATWKVVDLSGSPGWPQGKGCLQILTSRYRFDYYFDGDFLVERDKTGDQRKLLLVDNPSNP